MLSSLIVIAIICIHNLYSKRLAPGSRNDRRLLSSMFDTHLSSTHGHLNDDPFPSTPPEVFMLLKIVTPQDPQHAIDVQKLETPQDVILDLERRDQSMHSFVLNVYVIVMRRIL
eukprot:712685_1